MTSCDLSWAAPQNKDLHYLNSAYIITLANQAHKHATIQACRVSYLQKRKTLENQRVFIEPASVPQLPEG